MATGSGGLRSVPANDGVARLGREGGSGNVAGGGGVVKCTTGGAAGLGGGGFVAESKGGGDGLFSDGIEADVARDADVGVGWIFAGGGVSVGGPADDFVTGARDGGGVDGAGGAGGGAVGRRGASSGAVTDELSDKSVSGGRGRRGWGRSGSGSRRVVALLIIIVIIILTAGGVGEVGVGFLRSLKGDGDGFFVTLPARSVTLTV